MTTASKKKATEVAAPAANNALVVLTDNNTAAALPDYIKQGGGRGNEGVSTSDLVIPRLEIVQALSPCRKRTDPAYIEGAEEGMLYNNVTRKLYTGPVLVVPVLFKKEYQLWLDRQKSGNTQGFRGAFATDLEARQRRDELPQAEKEICELIEAHVHFCLLVDPNDGSVEEICLSMSRSKMKVSRRWNSLIRMFGGDRFSHVYKVLTVEESGQKGDFYNIALAAAGYPSKELYERAEALYDAIQRGERSVSREFEDDAIDADSEI